MPAPSVVEHQQRFVRAIGEACREADICFLLELLVYPLPGDSGQTTDYVEHREKRPQLVVDSIRAFADPAFGVDIFKLESPVAAEAVPEQGADGSDEAQAWFDAVRRRVSRALGDACRPAAPPPRSSGCCGMPMPPAHRATSPAGRSGSRRRRPIRTRTPCAGRS